MPWVDMLRETTLAVELPYISPGVRANMADLKYVHHKKHTGGNLDDLWGDDPRQ
jgi:hypothetical protein